MNPNIKTSIGSAMIKINAITTPPVPTAEPVGRVAGVMFVAFAAMLAINGINVLVNVVSGTRSAASTRPNMNAHIASTTDNINAKDTTGTERTSLPSIPNFTPPSLGTSML